MALVVDDHLLLNLLTETHPPWLDNELERSAVYTTGSWYYRVALAMTRGTGDGALSSRLTTLEPDRQRALLEKVGMLPQWIGLIGPRVLVPVMAALSVRRRPNLLTAEALAAALVTKGDLVVSVESPILHSGADDLGVSYRLV
jgi:hypothetical protein